MNYRHAFHAGNHADVLKHVVLLAVLDALARKPAPYFVLDTHAGRGRYDLGGDAAARTGEADAGIGRLMASDVAASAPPALRRYLEAVQAFQAVAPGTYPGSPLLAAAAMREQDRLAACELQPEEAAALAAALAGDRRCHVHPRDGYDAMRALLPPRDGATRLARGLVLIDPPYEAQEQEYPRIVAALRDGLARFPQGVFAVWYPIKRRPTLQPFLRKLVALPVREILQVELLVRPDDSPLRMNGSGLVLLSPPWKLDAALAPVLPVLARRLGEPGASWRLQPLKSEA